MRKRTVSFHNSKDLISQMQESQKELFSYEKKIKKLIASASIVLAVYDLLLQKESLSKILETGSDTKIASMLLLLGVKYNIEPVKEEEEEEVAFIPRLPVTFTLGDLRSWSESGIMLDLHFYLLASCSTDLVPEKYKDLHRELRKIKPQPPPMKKLRSFCSKEVISFV